MKITSIEFGQVTWIVDVSMPAGKIYLPEALEKIREKYGFYIVPSIESLVQQKGANVVFEHGKFEGSVIQRLSIHPDGFVASSLDGTDPVDRFLQDFLNWLDEEYGAQVLGLKDVFRVYDSHLVAQLDIDIEENMKFVEFIASFINQRIKEYDISIPDFAPSGFNLACDFINDSGPFIPPFTLERRRGHPFTNNLYFSAAPLKTPDHKRLLERIEGAI